MNELANDGHFLVNVVEIMRFDADTITVMYSSLFNIGDYVEIDTGSKGWIVDKYGKNVENMFLDIEFEDRTEILCNVATTRVKVVIYNDDNGTVHRNRSGLIRDTSVDPPSPLSTTTSQSNPIHNTTETTNTDNPPTGPSDIPTLDYFNQCVTDCYSWTKYNKSNK